MATDTQSIRARQYAFMQTIVTGLRSWELDVGEWERASGIALADAVKYTVMINMAPIFLGNSLQVGTCANSTALRAAQLQWCYSSRNFGANSTASSGNGTSADGGRMQVDSLMRGKRKGKGKKQHQRRNRTNNTSSTDINTCKICGKPGHWAKDCWRPGGGACGNSAYRNTGKGKRKNTGKGKGKHVDVVETEQLQLSETASTVSYPSQDPSVVGELSCIPSVDPWIMGVTLNAMSSTRRPSGAEYLLLDSAAQLHACPLTYPGQKIPLPDPGIHTASGARLEHDGGRLLTYKFPEGRTVSVLFHACTVLKPVLSLGRLAQQDYWRDLRADTGTLFFLDKTQTKHSHTQLHQEESVFFVKRMMVAPLTTAGVSDEVAQEIQMPVGPQMLEDVEEPMLARHATLRDPGTPDQIVMEQHNLTHFPSQFWCKMCVESRGHDSPHREQSKIDAVVPQLQFDYGYMGDGGPLQIACFFVGTDTSSGAIHETMVPDSKKMDMPYVVATAAKWVRGLGYERFCLHGDKKGVLQLLLDKVAKNVVLKDKTGRFCDKCYRHRAIRAMKQRRKPSPQFVDLLEHIWQRTRTKSRLLQ